MRGRVAARASAYELALYAAWQTERFAREKKLKPFARYLKRRGKPDAEVKPASPRAILATFSTLAGAGVPIKIERLR